MRALLALAALVGASLIQLLLSSVWPEAVLFFDLPLVVVIYYGLSKGPSVGLTLGCAAGLLQDTLTGSLFGAGAVARSLVGYVVGSASKRLVLAGPLPRFAIVAAGTLLARVLEFLTLLLMGRRLAQPPVIGIFAGFIGNGLVGGAILALWSREKQS